MKFESITFTTKDLVMIVGALISGFTFYLTIDKRFDDFEIKMQKIISQTELNEVKVNARFDGLKERSSNSNSCYQKNYYAIIPSNNNRKYKYKKA